jgi:allophanate hydrolase
MYSVPGPVPRPGLVRTGDGPADGIELEVWRLPYAGLGALLPTIGPPLALGRIELDDGRTTTGFVATPLAADTPDITSYGGWRNYLAATR